jgi:hypothetical protein
MPDALAEGAGVVLDSLVAHYLRRPVMGSMGTWKFRLSNRSWALIIPLLLLLALSISWNLRQRQLIAEERARTLAVQRKESARAYEEAERAKARKAKNAKWAGSDARLQQLYREIDTLSRLNEQVLSHPQIKPKAMVTIDNPAATLSAP